MSKRISRLGYGVSACAMSLGLASSAWAQTAPASGGLEEIVVTAQRRAENLQKVPVSVTAFGGDTLAARGMSQIKDLQKAIPSLNVSKSNGTLQPFLRGVGNLSSSVSNEASVSLYIDGVYFTRLPSSLFALRNVERVEVLKGPQGTLFGRNSSGGVIQVVTKDPSHTPAVQGSLSFGKFSTTEADIYATAGITDKVAADIAFSGRRQGTGYGVNLVSREKTSFEDYLLGRSKILFEPSDNSKITLSGFWSWNKNSTSGNSYPGTSRGYVSAPAATASLPPLGFWDADFDLLNHALSKTWGVSLNAAWTLPFATLTSITAYTYTNSYQIADGDYGARPDAVSLANYINHLATQELQLSSRKDERLTWVTGLYFYSGRSNAGEPGIYLYSPSGRYSSSYNNGIFATGHQLATSYAGYAQATYEVIDRLKVTGGIRYTYDDTHASGSVLFGTVTRTALGLPATQLAGAPNQITRKKVTYRAAVDYQFTDDVLGYASFSTGYKAGIFNLVTYDRNPNKPETVDAYEIGVKSELMDRKLRLNVAGWWYNVTNPQVQLLAATGASILFSNAQAARTKGVEVEATAALTSSLTGRASAAYTKSTYTSYTGAICTPQNFSPPFGRVSPQQSCNATGHYTPRSPKFVSTLGFDYNQTTSIGDFTLSADWNHNSGFFFQPSNDLHQKAYDLFDARMRFAPSEHLGISVWGKNLSNAKFADRATENAGGIGSPYEANPPRTFGIAVDFKF